MLSLIILSALLLALFFLLVAARWMRPLSWLAGCCITALVFSLNAAFVIGSARAQSVVSAASNSLLIPWGDILVQIVIALTPALLGLSVLAFTWVKSKLPKAIVTALDAAHADTLINRALYKAIALVEGAAKGKVVTVDVANDLIRQAAQFLIDEAPSLATQLGDRLNAVFAGKLAEQGMLPDDASAKNLAVAPTANPPKAVPQ